MSDRLIELLLKAVRRLPADEQDEVLGVLLGGVVPAPAPGSSQVGLSAIDPWHLDIPAGTLPAPTLGIGRGAGRPLLAQPLGALAALGGAAGGGSTDADTELKVLPVRLRVADYDRLRTFSREHGFSMAVIIRTLVERFLDERTTRPAAEPDTDPDGDAPG